MGPLRLFFRRGECSLRWKNTKEKPIPKPQPVDLGHDMSLVFFGGVPMRSRCLKQIPPGKINKMPRASLPLLPIVEPGDYDLTTLQDADGILGVPSAQKNLRKEQGSYERCATDM